MKKILGCLILACIAGGAARASSSNDQWIHVRVDDADGAGGRVDIQVPIGLVSSLLPALKGAHARGSIRVSGSADLRIGCSWPVRSPSTL